MITRFPADLLEYFIVMLLFIKFVGISRCSVGFFVLSLSVVHAVYNSIVRSHFLILNRPVIIASNEWIAGVRCVIAVVRDYSRWFCGQNAIYRSKCT